MSRLDYQFLRLVAVERQSPFDRVRDVLPSPGKDTDGAGNIVVEGDELRMTAPDVQLGVGRGRLKTDSVARQSAQSEEGTQSTAGQELRILLDHFSFQGDHEQFPSHRRAIVRKAFGIQLTIPPGQFIRREWKFAFDLEQEQPLEFFP